MSKKLRVVHKGTGVAGHSALRQIIDHPELELVGLWVHTPAKVGMDAGELCGAEPTGIIASDDVEAMLALDPDCLCYCPAGSGREAEATADVVRFLERGIDVSTHSLIAMTNPEFAPDETRKPIKEACARGGSTFFNTGTEPGVMSGQMAIAALSFAGDIESVRITEFGDPFMYGVEPIARNNMGFGMPADYVPPRFLNGRVLTWWRPVIDFVAKHLGVTFEDYHFWYDTATIDVDVDTAFGKVEKGSIGGTLWEVQGIVAGRPAIIIRHVSVIQPCRKDGWPTLPPGARRGGYQIEVRGSIDYDVNVLADHDPVTDSDVATIVTGTHTANAIPTVCASAPGVLDQFTIKPFVSKAVSRMHRPQG